MHQPWASLLVLGIKPSEGRVWPTDHRGPLWIHAASKKLEDEERRGIEGMFIDLYAQSGIDIRPLLPRQYPTSCLLGRVDVEDCLSQDDFAATAHTRPTHDVSGEPFVWICKNFHRLVMPFQMSGQHKLWNLEARVAKDALDGLVPSPPIPVPAAARPFRTGDGGVDAESALADELEEAQLAAALSLSLSSAARASHDAPQGMALARDDEGEDAELAAALSLSLQLAPSAPVPAPAATPPRAVREEQEAQALSMLVDLGFDIQTAAAAFAAAGSVEAAAELLLAASTSPPSPPPPPPPGFKAKREPRTEQRSAATAARLAAQDAQAMADAEAAWILHEQQQLEQQQLEQLEQPYPAAAAAEVVREEPRRVITVPLEHGSELLDTGNVFQAHLARVSSDAEAEAALAALFRDDRVRAASCVPWAYSYSCGMPTPAGRTRKFSNTKRMRCDDGGEAGAGKRLGELLQQVGAENVLVAVSRQCHKGYAHLGGRRWNHLCRLARELLEQCALDTRHGGGRKNDGGGGAKGKKKKKRHRNRKKGRGGGGGASSATTAAASAGKAGTLPKGSGGQHDRRVYVPTRKEAAYSAKHKC